MGFSAGGLTVHHDDGRRNGQRAHRGYGLPTQKLMPAPVFIIEVSSVFGRRTGTVLS